jgi:hypothetical protein
VSDNKEIEENIEEPLIKLKKQQNQIKLKSIRSKRNNEEYIEAKNQQMLRVIMDITRDRSINVGTNVRLFFKY